MFDVDYHYDRSGILKVHAKARHTGAVILDEELDCFGPDGTPIAQGLDRELERLLRRMIEPAVIWRGMREGVMAAAAEEAAYWTGEHADLSPRAPYVPVRLVEAERRHACPCPSDAHEISTRGP
ncbi:hypothetical protein [Streptomyces tirandamycinicus]|uniref:hypothetical protein n=1 Tax=Streptomyces tirandamycinicus TaxID=2174846 RepID=UPI0011B22795|nr:hypothetical protein [Streptomyces tirandamycinicus]